MPPCCLSRYESLRIAHPDRKDRQKYKVVIPDVHVRPSFRQTIFDGFDMFASAESRSLEIHAGTIIPFAVGSTIHHLVLVVLFRVANDILSRAKGVINTTDIEVLDIGHLLAQFDLPFL